jgi:anti-sigma B factor antagonist
MGTDNEGVSMSESGVPELPDSRIDVENRAGVWVLSLHGEHDLATQPSLREQLQHVRAAGGPIVVDLSPTTFVDSTIIGALIESAADLEPNEPGVFAVTPPGSAARRLCDLVGLGDALPVHDDLVSAIDTARMAGSGEAAP